MVYVVIKEGDRIEIVGEENFSADKNENYLHKLIEENTYIISREITENHVITLGSRLRLPSGGELDLLLIDPEGNIMLVELKKGKGYREAIAQLLDYASELQMMNPEDLFNCRGIKFKSLNEVYELFKSEDFEELSYEQFEENVRSCLNNPRNLQLLLVSYRIGEDTSRLVSWLRKFGVNIRCIEFSYFRKGKREVFVPKLVEVGEIKPPITRRQKKYLRFFTELLSRFKAKKPGVTERKASTDGWLKIPVGYSDLHFEWRFIGKEPEKCLEVALHFESADEKENEKLMDYFVARKEEIKQKIGEEIFFGRLGKKWRSIYTRKEVKTLDDALASEEVKRWAVDTMVKFYDTLKPLLDKAIREIRG